MKSLRISAPSTTLLTLALVIAPAFAANPPTTSRLRDLADGETHTYGSGDHQVTAERHGDLVTLTIPEQGREDRVLTVDIAGGDGIVRITEGQAAAGAASGKLVLVKKRVDDDGVTSDVLTASALATSQPEAAPAIAQSVAPTIHPLFETADGSTVSVGGIDGVTWLRCPKGDAAMRLAAGDSGTYRCPRHGVALVPGTPDALLRAVVVADEAQGIAKKGEIPLSFENKTMGGGDKTYTGRPLSLDF